MIAVLLHLQQLLLGEVEGGQLTQSLLVEILGFPEVAYFYSILTIEKYILRLNIPVTNELTVHGSNTEQDLSNQFPTLQLRDLISPFLYQRPERPVLSQLHQVVKILSILKGCVQPDNLVDAVELVEAVALHEDTRCEVGPPSDVALAYDFDCEKLPTLLFFGLEHLAKRALTQRSYYLELFNCQEWVGLSDGIGCFLRV